MSGRQRVTGSSPVSSTSLRFEKSENDYTAVKFLQNEAVHVSDIGKISPLYLRITTLQTSLSTPSILIFVKYIPDPSPSIDFEHV